MRRLLPFVLVLALASPAAAKEIVKAEVCGSDRCVDVTSQAGPGLIEGSPTGSPPAGGGAYVRVRMAIGDGKRVMERWTTRFDLATGTLRAAPGGDWLAVSPEATRVIRTAAQDVQTFASLGSGSDPSPKTPAVGRGSDPEPNSRVVWVILATAAGALLAAVAVVSIRRRRAIPG